MPKPCSAQCPAMIAALRQPAIGSVTGLRSGVMKRALRGSPSIAVLAAMSEARHCRRMRRSVSIPAQPCCGSTAPFFSCGIICLSSCPESVAHLIFHARLAAKYGEEKMSWLPSNDPVLGDAKTCDALDLIIVPRTRDLGDGFAVRRALPHGKRQMVGPFIFFDHFGPVQFMAGKGMDVRPHPHIGLATVTYLFDGSIMHRD